jgi:hypothetical protein
LVQDLLRQQYETRIVRHGHYAAAFRRGPPARPVRVLPQEQARAVLILLRDHFPAPISQQRHKQSTWIMADPLRVHSGRYDIEALRLTAL